MKIEIVTSQNGSLKETGFGAPEACTAVMNAISDLNHDVVVTVCRDLADLEAIVKRKPDFLVLAMKYVPLENGQLIWLSEYFEEHHMQYTGSQKANLLYDSDKVSAKIQVASQGIATAEFFVTKPNEFATEPKLPLPLPLFIKPLNAANGNGVDRASIALTFDQYEHKVEALYKEFQTPILVEAFLTGREFTISVIENDGQLLVAPVEVVAPDEDGFKFLGAKVKSENTELLKRVSVFEVHTRASELARRVFIALGARDFARIDIMMDKNGLLHFIEANLVPGMTKGSSYFPRSCAIESGMEYDDTVGLMIQGAVARKHASSLTVPADGWDPKYGPPDLREMSNSGSTHLVQLV